MLAQPAKPLSATSRASRLEILSSSFRNGTFSTSASSAKAPAVTVQSATFRDRKVRMIVSVQDLLVHISARLATMSVVNASPRAYGSGFPS
jgi:hypothetical protein